MSQLPRSPHPASSRRRALVLALAGVGVIAALVLALVLLRERPRRAPSTVEEALAMRQAEARAARAAAIGDTSRVGRVLLLPPVNATGDTALDEHVRAFDETLRNSLASGFTPLVPRAEVDRLVQAAAAERRPTTSELQVRGMMLAARAPLSLETTFTRSGDSVLVWLQLRRRYAPAPGDTSREGTYLARAVPIQPYLREAAAVRVEPLSMRPVARGPRDRPWEASMPAVHQAVRAIASMETCDTTARVTAGAAPWCWETPSSLRVVPERLEGYPGFLGRPRASARAR